MKLSAFQPANFLSAAATVQEMHPIKLDVERLLTVEPA